MVERRKRARKRKLNKTFWILLFFFIMIAVVGFSALLQKQKPLRKDAAYYFQISDATVYGQFIDDEKEILRVLRLRFNLTAIGGSASYGWVIPGEGTIPSNEWPRFHLAQGQSEPINILYNYREVTVTRTLEGFYQLHVQIDCYEATTFGFITINATLPE